jgi:hypothetical protein
MPVGYNHNVCYRSRIFHAQTEACGNDNPVVVTHLFLQGAVVASLRTGYSHLLEDPELEDKLRELMQEQHKLILKQLRRGELDAKADALGLAPTEILQTELPKPDRTVVQWPPKLSPGPARPLPQEIKRSTSSATFSPTVPPRSTPLEPAMEPEPMLQAVPTAELMDEPLSAAEQNMLRRGQTISLALASIAVPREGPGTFDDPAFDGVPMLDLDLSEDSSLDLDLEAIGRLDFEPAKVAAPEQVVVIAPAPEPQPEPEPTPAAAPDPRPAAGRPTRAKKPSLPMAPVAVELPEGIDTRKRES